jgi:hypothetical protein
VQQCSRIIVPLPPVEEISDGGTDGQTDTDTTQNRFIPHKGGAIGKLGLDGEGQLLAHPAPRLELLPAGFVLKEMQLHAFHFPSIPSP